MDYMHAIIVSIVEGVTEFLPISSTAHILIYQRLTGHEFGEIFNIVIQLGAMLAVVVATPKKILRSKSALLAISSAVVPTLAIAFLLKDHIKFLHGNMIVIGSMLTIGGFFILLFERWHNKRPHLTSSERFIESLTVREAMIIGIAQSFAIIPGVSRSLATIFTGLSLKLSRVEAVEFSFLVGAPVMAVASAYQILKHFTEFTAGSVGILLTGTTTSFLVALLVIKTLLKWAATHNFTGFGYYRIIAGLLILSIALGVM